MLLAKWRVTLPCNFNRILLPVRYYNNLPTIFAPLYVLHYVGMYVFSSKYWLNVTCCNLQELQLLFMPIPPYIQYLWKLISNFMALTALFQNNFHDDSVTKLLSISEMSTPILHGPCFLFLSVINELNLA